MNQLAKSGNQVEQCGRLALLMGVGLGVLSGPTMGIIIRHDVDPALHLALGANPAFDSVGEIGFVNQTGGVAGATGVLIDPEWVLISAHRVAQDPGFDWAFRHNEVVHDISEIIYHPGYDGSATGTTGSDLALVRLTNPIEGAYIPTLTTLGMAFGDEVALVGFGGIGDGNGNGRTFTTERWAAMNTWDQRENHAEYYITDFDRPESGALALEGSTTNGDTGAGIFHFTNGQWELAGLGSHVLDTNLSGMFGDYGDRARHTRLEVYRPWIDSIVPAPGGVGVMGIFGLVGCRRRRRQ